jgi:membrane-associated phospholipid phosphatase
MEIQRRIQEVNRLKIFRKLTVSVGSFVLFIFLAYLIYTEKALWLDQLLVDLSRTHITGTTYSIISFFTNLGDKVIVISIAVLSLIVLWWKTKDYWGMGTIAVVLIGSNELFKLLKEVFQRERPIFEPAIDATGYSFPSGHSTVSMAFYGILIYFIIKYMKSTRLKAWVVRLLCCYILIMGLCRVFLQAHYLSDVLAGFAIGFVYLMICTSIYESIVLRSHQMKKKSELTM